jgi:hypothetical protein
LGQPRAENPFLPNNIQSQSPEPTGLSLPLAESDIDRYLNSRADLDLPDGTYRVDHCTGTGQDPLAKDFQLWREEDFETPDLPDELLFLDMEIDYDIVEVHREFYSQYSFFQSNDIEIRIGDCNLVLSRDDLDVLTSKYRKLEKQYYFLRTH